MKIKIGKYPKDITKERIVNVTIEEQDTWNMDETLALIIVPMLKQLKEQKQGAPHVDEGDVPENLWAPDGEDLEDGDVDSNWFKRWEYVIDEMIWSFEQCLIDWEEQYYKYVDDPNKQFKMRLVWSDDNGRKAHQERMTNGFTLFGKYYQCLWS